MNVIGFRETIDHLERGAAKKPGQQTDSAVPPPITGDINIDSGLAPNGTEKGGKALEDESNSILVPPEEKSYKCSWAGRLFDDGSQISVGSMLFTILYHLLNRAACQFSYL